MNKPIERLCIQCGARPARGLFCDTCLKENTDKRWPVEGSLTDEQAKTLFPQNEKWIMVYDFCRLEGMSPTEAVNHVLTCKIEGY